MAQNFKKTTGLSQEEILEFTKSIAPKGIDITKVTEHEEGFGLHLKPNFGIEEASYAIWKTGYHQPTSPNNEREILERIRERTKEDIKQAIKKFSEHFFELAEDNLDLKEYLKRKYGEKDAIYIVNRHHEIKEAPKITRRYDLDYYSVVAKNNIPNYDNLWQKMALDQFSHEYSQELFEYMHGALERYKQALFARDIIRDVLEEGTDNDNVFLVNFHFYYFITLIKALGDNLAWILNYFYRLGLQATPGQIDLTKTSFRNKLESANKALFKNICQGSGYENYRKLRDFRDIVIHKHALHVVTVQMRMSGPKKVMVPIDPTTGVMVDNLKRQKQRSMSKVVSDKQSIAKYGLKEMVVALVPEEDLQYEDIIIFCEGHLKFIAESYGQALKDILSETK